MKTILSARKWKKSLSRTTLSAVLVGLTAIWFWMGNLACFEDLPFLGDLLLRREIVFTPSVAPLVPGQSTTVTAEMTWADDGKVDANWNVFAESVKALSGATLSPQSGSHHTAIQLTAAEYEELPEGSQTFTNSPATEERLPVTAAYEDPLVKLGAEFDFKPLPRVERGYLPLKILAPRLHLESWSKPSFRGDGLVQLASVLGEVKVLDVSADWKYNFLFRISISGQTKTIAEYTSPAGLRFTNVVVRSEFGTFTNQEINIVVAPNGQSASFSLPNLEIGEDNIDGIAIQTFTIYVEVKAVRSGGGSTKELIQAHLEKFGANSRNYWNHKDSVRVIY